MSYEASPSFTDEVRIEKDSLGEVRVPVDALYGAQTQRAINNFKISGLRFPSEFISALALIKGCCAEANAKFEELDTELSDAIQAVALEIGQDDYSEQFPVDVMQTGSGTSINMNMNEVIATLAGRRLGRHVHPNDQVNRSQSSNDVIPTAIHVSTYQANRSVLLPALSRLSAALGVKAREVSGIIKTGRTHLMDALPMRMGQELRAWRHQVLQSAQRIRSVLPRLGRLPIGGTAIGTGLNAPPGFGQQVVQCLSQTTGIRFRTSSNAMADISSPDTAAELSGALRAVAVPLMKISNDLRWMNSGPNAGLNEISLPALQPGSSIMPGKVNPVIPEAVAMACTQVYGNDTAIGMAAQAGSFQLNTMLPLIACNLLQSIQLLANSADHLANRAVGGFTVHRNLVEERAKRNPILVTALAPRVGYDCAAEIVHWAQSKDVSIVEAAVEFTGLPREEIERALDPGKLTGGRRANR